MKFSTFTEHIAWVPDLSSRAATGNAWRRATPRGLELRLSSTRSWSRMLTNGSDNKYVFPRYRRNLVRFLTERYRHHHGHITNQSHSLGLLNDWNKLRCFNVVPRASSVPSPLAGKKWTPWERVCMTDTPFNTTHNAYSHWLSRLDRSGREIRCHSLGESSRLCQAVTSSPSASSQASFFVPRPRRTPPRKSLVVPRS